MFFKKNGKLKVNCLIWISNIKIIVLKDYLFNLTLTADSGLETIPT